MRRFQKAEAAHLDLEQNKHKKAIRVNIPTILLTFPGFGNIRRNTLFLVDLKKDCSFICQSQTTLLLYPHAHKKFILVSVTSISSTCWQLIILFYKKRLMGICCTAIYMVKNVIFSVRFALQMHWGLSGLLVSLESPHFIWRKLSVVLIWRSFPERDWLISKTILRVT